MLRQIGYRSAIKRYMRSPAAASLIGERNWSTSSAQAFYRCRARRADLAKVVRLIIRPLLYLNPVQPQLAPISGDRPGAIEPASGILRITDDSFENDARLLHLNHLAGHFVENLRDRALHAKYAAAIGRHFFRIERQTAVKPVSVDGFFDLALWLYADQFARLQIKSAGWCLFARLHFLKQIRCLAASESLVHPFIEGWI